MLSPYLLFIYPCIYKRNTHEISTAGNYLTVKDTCFSLPKYVNNRKKIKIEKPISSANHGIPRKHENTFKKKAEVLFDQRGSVQTIYEL